MDLDKFKGHTPGPWKAEHNTINTGFSTVTQSHDGTRIFMMVARQRAKSDAELIAAAPDLLQECLYLKNWKGEAEKELVKVGQLVSDLERLREENERFREKVITEIIHAVSKIGVLAEGDSQYVMSVYQSDMYKAINSLKNKH